jgi:hypothetical protein
MNITITLDQYNAIRQLKHFAQWYVDEHKGASGAQELIDQWQEDHHEVERGVQALNEVDKQINWS